MRNKTKSPKVVSTRDIYDMFEWKRFVKVVYSPKTLNEIGALSKINHNTSVKLWYSTMWEL